MFVNTFIASRVYWHVRRWAQSWPKMEPVKERNNPLFFIQNACQVTWNGGAACSFDFDFLLFDNVRNFDVYMQV